MSVFIIVLQMLLLLTGTAKASPLLGRIHPGGQLLAAQIGNPPQKLNLQLDLDEDVSLLVCTTGSSPIPCSSTSMCPSKKCSPSSQCLQPISQTSSVPLHQESLVLETTDTSSAPLSNISLRGVTFGCKKNGRGIAALSKTSLSLPRQISSVQNGPQKFTLCLSPTKTSQLYFGDDSNIVLGGISFPQSSFLSVPFVSNPVHPSHYYLPVQTIRISDNGAELGKSPPSVFAIDTKSGKGGIKFSSREKYTKLARPAYLAVKDAFKKYVSNFNIPVVPSVGSLEFCLDGSKVNGNRLGPVVPTVELEMGSGTTWTLAGFSVVEFINGSACLAFVDAGPLPVTSSIGLYQQYDNLLRFDIGASVFSFIDRGLHLYRMNCGV